MKLLDTDLCVCGKPRHQGLCAAKRAGAVAPPGYCGCGKPFRHVGMCSVRWAMRRANADGPRKAQRRFTQHFSVGKSNVLPADHSAAVNASTRFWSRIRGSGGDRQLLKSAEHSRKIGSPVVKGWLDGARVVTLTLEERHTCPRDCVHWLECYGNAMHWPLRIRPDDGLMPRLELELKDLCRRNKRVLVRLHVLGDFYSPAYVWFWWTMLERHPGLHIFGYTARRMPDPIALAIGALNEHARSFIRWSDGEQDSFRSIVVDNADQALEAGAIVCPVQTGGTDCCSTCGLCWTTPKTIAFLRH